MPPLVGIDNGSLVGEHDSDDEGSLHCVLTKEKLAFALDKRS